MRKENEEIQTHLTNLVMHFNDKLFRGYAEGNPQKYLDSDQDRVWYAAIEDAQNQVTIYTSPSYKGIIGRFERVGNIKAYDFFKGTSFESQQNNDESITAALKEKGYIAPEHNEDNVITDRQQTKYRVIAANIPYVQDDGSIKFVKTLTATAPNLLGSSLGDSKRFINDDNKLNFAEYKSACDEIVDLIVFAAKDQKLVDLRVADFGLGVYLKQLSEDDKNNARKIMYSAFIEAAKKHNQPVTWIVWDKAENADQLATQLNNGVFKETNVSAVTGNIVNPIDMENVGLLNNGSDRTIGGAMWTINPKTTEEQLAQRSFIVFVKTTMNPHLKNNIMRMPDNVFSSREFFPDAKTEKNLMAESLETLTKKLDAYKSQRENDKREYYSFFKKPLWGYSKSEKLNAVDKLKSIFNGKENVELDQVTLKILH